MSTWERIDRDGNAHALTQAQDRRARQKFNALYSTTKMRAAWDPGKREDIDEEPDHLLIGTGRRDGTTVRLIGLARDLHGPNGVCICCPRGGAT